MALVSSQPIILFWSEHSPNCAKLRGMMSPQHLQLFEKVCIDAPQIREVIVDSSNLGIREVPCFLFLDQQGQIKGKFEGQSAFQWFKSLTGHSQHSLPIQETQHPLSHTRAPHTIPEQPVGSSVDKILGGMKGLARGQVISETETGEFPRESIEFQGSRVSGAQGRNRNVPVTKSRPRADMGRFINGSLQEEFPEEESFAEEQRFHQNRPVKGEGHENMVSSLSGFGRAEKDQGMGGMGETDEQENAGVASKMVSVGKGKRTIVIEDFSPNMEAENQSENRGITNDDDPSGMSIPRGDIPIAGEPPKKSTNSDQVVRQGTMGGRGDKGKAIKDAAASMAASRQAEMETQSEKQQGRAQPARNRAKKSAVNL